VRWNGWKSTQMSDIGFSSFNQMSRFTQGVSRKKVSDVMLNFLNFPKFKSTYLPATRKKKKKYMFGNQPTYSYWKFLKKSLFENQPTYKWIKKYKVFSDEKVGKNWNFFLEFSKINIIFWRKSRKIFENRRKTQKKIHGIFSKSTQFSQINLPI